MPLSVTTLNVWQTSTGGRKKFKKTPEGLAAVDGAIERTLETKNVAQFLEEAPKIVEALDQLKEKRKIAFTSAIAALRKVVMDDIQHYLERDEKAAEEAARQIVVQVDDWLDEHMPLQIGGNDRYLVIGEDAGFRRFRRNCVKLDLQGIAPHKGVECSVSEIISAVLKPILIDQQPNRYVWSPGQRCHWYVRGGKGIYPGGFESRYVNQRSTLHEQKQAYIEQVFNNANYSDDYPKIDHSFQRTGVGQQAVVTDVTYLQFFNGFAEFNWRQQPAVFSGSLADFQALF